MPPLHLRQEFPTLKAFKDALHAWAIEAHFEPRILKSDTSRVRVGCKRDPQCPFVIRCNWERKGGRTPCARVTVLKERHTCLDGVAVGVPWPPDNNPMGLGAQNTGDGDATSGMGRNSSNGLGMGVGIGGMGGRGVDMRQDEHGNILGGVRVLGAIDPVLAPGAGTIVPVLPKVQRNSASRLPFLMENLPKIMNITKETSPAEIRDALLREFGAEVHLQQCRRAKGEILKRQAEAEAGGDPIPTQGQAQAPSQAPTHVPSQAQVQAQAQAQVQTHAQAHSQVQAQVQAQEQSMRSQDMTRLRSDTPNDANQQIYRDINSTPTHSPHPYAMHGVASGPMAPTPTAAVTTLPNLERAPPPPPPAPLANMRATPSVSVNGPGQDAPVRCPFCLNQRWMRSIQDAVEHMSMHVVV